MKKTEKIQKFLLILEIAYDEPDTEKQWCLLQDIDKELMSFLSTRAKKYFLLEDYRLNYDEYGQRYLKNRIMRLRRDLFKILYN